MTTFGFNTRVMLCPNCAAPSEVPVQGGAAFCGYCGQQSQWTPRVEQPLAPQGRPALSEQERLQRLRAQDGKPLLPPPALQGLIEGGTIPDWKLAEAQQIWQSTRQQVATSQDYAAAEQLLFLTMMLSNTYSQKQDYARQRALFEGALEAFQLPRHKQMMRGFLARSAAAEGDIAAAEAWLSPCDLASDDLQADSSYRLSRAAIDTATGNFNGVLNVLGRNQREVPIMDAMDAAATVFRANALERIGDVQGAATVLQQYMGAGGASGRMALQAIIERYASWNLCQATMQSAQSQYAQRASSAAAARASGGIGGIFFLVGLVMLLGAVGAGVAAAFGKGSFAMIPGLAIGGAVFAVIGHRSRVAAKKAAHLRTHGVQAKGTIVNVARTGTRINNVPQYQITLSISLDGQPPYNASTKMLLPPGSAGQFKPGLALPVRVDPNDPQSFILELD